MLLIQFVLQDGHFALNVLASLIFFAVSWLYLDAYFTTRAKKNLLKILGFAILSVSFLIHATHIEQVAISNLTIGGGVIETASQVLKVLGYLLIIADLIIDPIQKKPVITNSYEPSNLDLDTGNAKVPLAAGFMFPFGIAGIVWYFSYPVFAFIAFILMLRQATIGLEKHLKPLAFGFFFIFLYELFSLPSLFENTNSVYIYNLVQPFGPFWIAAHFLQLIGIIIIGRWVFGYLLKQLQTQLFMILNISVLIIFLATTVSFTGLLLNNLTQAAFSHLDTDVSVVSYAIGLKQNQTLSDAELVSQNVNIINAVSINDKKTLKDLSTSILLSKKESYLIIVASNGAVLMRGEDNEKIGDSLSGDSLFIRAMRGEKVSSVVVKDGSVAPTVSIRSSAPIVSYGQTVGAVIVGTDIDNAFVDGLKSSTKLDVSIYGGKTLSATTFVAPDGKSRYIGVKEENRDINKNILIEGKNYSLETNILNTSYFAAFAPLKDVDGNPVGMLFVGQKQISIIQAASASIGYTFLIAVLFILISIIPSFMISKFINSQFK